MPRHDVHGMCARVHVRVCVCACVHVCMWRRWRDRRRPGGRASLNTASPPPAAMRPVSPSGLITETSAAELCACADTNTGPYSFLSLSKPVALEPTNNFFDRRKCPHGGYIPKPAFTEGLSAASGASAYPANRDFKGHVGGCAGRSPARIFFYLFPIFFRIFLLVFQGEKG